MESPDHSENKEENEPSPQNVFANLHTQPEGHPLMATSQPGDSGPMRPMMSGDMASSLRQMLQASGDAHTALLQVLSEMIVLELTAASRAAVPLLGDFSTAAMDYFNWDAVLQAYEDVCPLLLLCFRTALTNKCDQSEASKDLQESVKPAIGVIMSLILYLAEPQRFNTHTHIQVLIKWLKKWQKQFEPPKSSDSKETTQKESRRTKRPRRQTKNAGSGKLLSKIKAQASKRANQSEALDQTNQSESMLELQANQSEFTKQASESESMLEIKTEDSCGSDDDNQFDIGGFSDEDPDGEMIDVNEDSPGGSTDSSPGGGTLPGKRRSESETKTRQSPKKKARQRYKLTTKNDSFLEGEDSAEADRTGDISADEDTGISITDAPDISVKEEAPSSGNEEEEEYVMTSGNRRKRVLKCAECDFRTLYGTSMQRHSIQKHNKAQGLQCVKCGKVYPTTSALREHVQNKHEGFKHVCHYCGRDFGTRQGLRGHVRSDHEHKYSYQCELCQKTYQCRTTYEEHINMHNGIKPYVCSICSKAFHQKTSFQRHERSCRLKDRRELTLEDLTCMICNKRFASKLNLKEHTAAKHGDTVRRCPCGEEFRWRRSFYRHQQKCMHMYDV